MHKWWNLWGFFRSSDQTAKFWCLNSTMSENHTWSKYVNFMGNNLSKCPNIRYYRPEVLGILQSLYKEYTQWIWNKTTVYRLATAALHFQRLWLLRNEFLCCCQTNEAVERSGVHIRYWADVWHRIDCSDQYEVQRVLNARPQFIWKKISPKTLGVTKWTVTLF